MNKLISSMNTKMELLTNDWPEFFKTKLHFSQSLNGTLYFNEFPIYKGNDLILQATEITINRITFYFDKNRFIKIEMLWKEDEEPVVDSVVYGYLFNT